MAVFKELQLSEDADMKQTMKAFYRFGEELRYTFNNIDEDNLGNAYIMHVKERTEQTRSILFDAGQLQMEFEDEQQNVSGALRQSESNISMLVESGSVVSTMLSRMELYGDHIDLKTGHVIFDTNNFKLDQNGNAVFSGKITGGSILIGSYFAVDSTGHAVIKGNLKCNVLNPRKSTVVGGNVDIEGDEGYGYCRVGGALTGADAFIMDSLSCKRVRYTSDARAKESVEEIKDAARIVARMKPVSFRYLRSGRRSMGFIAQDIQEAQGSLQMTGSDGDKLKLAYDLFGAVYTGAIQENQMRIDRIRNRLMRGGRM